MPNRSINDPDDYRYGFNGKENDNDVNGDGNKQDYGMRIYDPRIGKFMSLDPLFKKYPYYTPYSFAGNTPIHAIDLDGLEELIHQYLFKDGKATLIKTVENYELEEQTRYMSSPTTGVPISYRVYEKMRNGKPLPSSEVNMEQYQYFDENGNRLNLRRNYEGDYVEGSNELMEISTKNLMGSVYIGPSNPEYVRGGKNYPDYRREPQDEIDAAALQHDQAYDKARTAGASGAFYNQDTRPADQDLVNSANEVINKYKVNGVDNITGQKVSSRTLSRANIVRSFFNWVLTHTKPESPRPAVNDTDNPGRLKSYEPKF